eukprot:CAMPEP_0115005602 /NCGR_PEP_ID=MMETSP0216-20121206/19980_1 /TAXON_ID=223996 /ORGANISM="Protocruzia adherens, Strain Boccale" /LENGTH=135 /DNA_ID=CAMNT_0002371981 /DNA_START=386 /DNA_END=793 /DNA_ORIENTATION=-
MLEELDATFTGHGSVKIESVHPSCSRISFKRHYEFTGENVTGVDFAMTRVDLGHGDHFTLLWKEGDAVLSESFDSVENSTFHVPTSGFTVEYITGGQEGWGFEFDATPRGTTTVEPSFVTRRSFLSKQAKLGPEL